MLYTMKEIIKMTDSEQRGVAAFNVFGYEDAKAVTDAAEKLGRPVILMVNKPAAAHMGLAVIGGILLQLAKNAQVPVGVHLDHATEFKVINEAIELGFTSVMLDASQFPFDENVRRSKEVVSLAHSHGVSVEAEIGAVGYSGAIGYKARYTEPSEAGEFVVETKVDAVAVAVGTVHRMQQQGASIQFERLKSIYERTGTPLVIHGSSGIRDEELKELAACGVRKVNFGTVLRMAFGQEMRRQIETDKNIFDRIELFKSCMEKVEEKAAEKIRLI